MCTLGSPMKDWVVSPLMIGPLDYSIRFTGLCQKSGTLAFPLMAPLMVVMLQNLCRMWKMPLTLTRKKMCTLGSPMKEWVVSPLMIGPLDYSIRFTGPWLWAILGCLLRLT
eukprot:gene2308-3033_t